MTETARPATALMLASAALLRCSGDSGAGAGAHGPGGGSSGAMVGPTGGVTDVEAGNEPPVPIGDDAGSPAVKQVGAE